MKILPVLIVLLLSNASYGQKTPHSFSLPDSIRKYFNYDTLKNFSCKETPAGIYIIRFKINSQNKIYDYKFSNNSLILLKNLFESALIPSVGKNHNLTFDKEYLQQIYYNNYFWCIYEQDTTSKKAASIDKEVSELLSEQIMAIENSLSRISLDEKSEVIVLNPAIINNVNPNRPVPKGFQNDYRKGDIKELSDDKLSKLIEEVKRRRESQTKSGKD